MRTATILAAAVALSLSASTVSAVTYVVEPGGGGDLSATECSIGAVVGPVLRENSMATPAGSILAFSGGCRVTEPTSQAGLRWLACVEGRHLLDGSGPWA